MKGTIFISYSSQDKVYADAIRKLLSERGATVFMPEEQTTGGDTFKETVLQAIAGSACVVGIITPTSIHSTWVNQELGFAMAAKKPTMLLVEKKLDGPIGILSGKQYWKFDENDPKSTARVFNEAVAKVGSFSRNSQSDMSAFLAL